MKTLKRPNTGFWFSIIWAAIITAILLYLEGYIRTGVLDPFEMDYKEKLWKLFYLIVSVIFATYQFIQIRLRKEVEKLEQRMAEESTKLSDLQKERSKLLAMINGLRYL